MEAKLAAYASRTHKRVHGWLSQAAIDIVLNIAGTQSALYLDGNVGEIGVHHGKLFILLYLLSVAGERALAIDLFDMQELNVDRSGSGDFVKFQSNLKRHADTTRLVVHKGDSMRLTGQDLIALAGGPFRLFSVDGGHSPVTTAHDLEAVESALADGGVIVLDDVFNERWPGVVSGTVAYLSTPRRVVPFAAGGNKVLFTQRDHVERYSASLQRLGPRRAVTANFMGHQILCLDLRPLRFSERLARTRFWENIRGTLVGNFIRAAGRAFVP